MRLSVLVISAVFALAMTDVGFAQATLPNDATNSANNPGTMKVEGSVKEQALDCSCRFTAPGAGTPGPALSGGSDRVTNPEQDAGAGDQIFDCSCGKATPDTTGALATPKSDRGPAAAPNSSEDGSALSR